MPLELGLLLLCTTYIKIIVLYNAATYVRTVFFFNIGRYRNVKYNNELLYFVSSKPQNVFRQNTNFKNKNRLKRSK